MENKLECRYPGAAEQCVRRAGKLCGYKWIMTALILPLVWSVLPPCARAQQDSGQSVLEWKSDTLATALPLEGEYEFVSARAGLLTVAAPRIHARPGDRWIEILVGVDDAMASKADARLVAGLYPIDGRQPDQPWQAALLLDLAQKDANSSRRGMLRVDLRRGGLDRARLRVELRHAGDNGLPPAVEELFLTLSAPIRPLLPGERIPVRLDLPVGMDDVKNRPVKFGMPFPAGALWDTGQLRLVDETGLEVPAQHEITGRWAEEGSVMWLRFDALADSDRSMFVEVAGPGAGTVPDVPLRVEDTGDNLFLDTGVARFELGRIHSPVIGIERAGRKTVSAGARGLYVVDNEGRIASAGPMNVLIESQGPVAATVRFEGFYLTAEGEPLARHITRLEVYAGRPEAHVTHTLIITRDTNEIWFREVGWEFDVVAGDDPKAFFAAPRADREGFETVPLTRSNRSAWMLQGDHVQFGGGENRFRLAVGKDYGTETILLEGEEMGDWAALQGSAGGLAIACREAARQHPKEFNVSDRNMALLLFSGRDGEQLDFRPATLAARWNRGGRLNDRRGRIVKRGESLAPVVAETHTSAVGWSKTHHLMLMPLATEEPASIILSARLNTEPFYALADPAWLYETRVLGSLYPRDRERFPAAEEFIETALEPFFVQGHERDGEYGFIDYFAGPHYRTMGQYRYPATYSLRPAFWLQYARSGDRRLREFAEGTTGAYMDNYICHWVEEGDGRTRGLATRGSGIRMMTPYYWGDGTLVSSFDGPAWICQFMLHYQIGGYRRARDVLEQYAEGLKNASSTHAWYRERRMRNIAGVYLLTWDPELRIMLENSIADLYDPASAIFTRKSMWPHGKVLYKTAEHTPIPIMFSELLGDRRLEKIARGWAEANYYGYAYTPSRLGGNPLIGRFEKGLSGYYLHEQTGQAHLAEEMLMAVSRSIPGRSQSVSSINYDIMGIVYGLALIAETEVDRESVAAWAAYDDAAAEGNVRAFIRKGDNETLNMYSLRANGIDALGKTSRRLCRVAGVPPAVIHLHIPGDSGTGDYELKVGGERGYNFVFSDSRHPLVLHVEGAWQPAPLEAVQWPPIYFSVPAGAENPRIHFEGKARLIAPDGQSWLDNEPQSGWVELAGAPAGLWAFIPVENKAVRVENIPPFFAFRDSAFHFMPDNMEINSAEDEEDDD